MLTPGKHGRCRRTAHAPCARPGLPVQPAEAHPRWPRGCCCRRPPQGCLSSPASYSSCPAFHWAAELLLHGSVAHCSKEHHMSRAQMLGACFSEAVDDPSVN